MQKSRADKAKYNQPTKLVLLGAALIALLGAAGVAVAATLTSPTSIRYIGAPVNASLQGFTPTMCASMQTYTTLKLTDSRNSQEYLVRKMPDGKCWMIDNLKLSGVTLTATDSDVTTDFTIPAKPVNSTDEHGEGLCIGGTAVAKGGYLTCDGTWTSSAANLAYVAYSDPANSHNSAGYVCPSHSAGSPDSLTDCGYLYNWYTATAGSGGYNQATEGTQAEHSICPVGWRLPSVTSGTTGPTSNGTSVTAADFPVLNASMLKGSPATGAAADSGEAYLNWFSGGPFQATLAGYYGQYFGFSGSSGGYWSSTAHSRDDAKLLSVRLTNVNTSDSDDKYYANAVRCVLR